MTNADVVRDVLEAFNRGDLARVLCHLDPEIEWALAEGHPYSPEGATWRGHEELTEKFFARAAGDWDDFAVSLRKLHDAGDSLVAEVRYSGRLKATDVAIDAQGCHVWELEGGKVVRFQQYVDTARLREAMRLASI